MTGTVVDRGEGVVFKAHSSGKGNVLGLDLTEEPLRVSEWPVGLRGAAESGARRQHSGHGSGRLSRKAVGSAVRVCLPGQGHPHVLRRAWWGFLPSGALQAGGRARRSEAEGS